MKKHLFRPLLVVGRIWPYSLRLTFGQENAMVVLGDIKPYLDDVIQRGHALLPEKIKEKIDGHKHAWDIAQAFPLPINLIPFPAKITTYKRQDRARDRLWMIY